MKKVEVKFRIPAFLITPFLPVLLLYRRLRCGYAFRRIRLTRSLYAIIDPDAYDRLSRYKWHAVGKERRFYALTYRWDAKKRQTVPCLMHRLVLKAPANLLVDHINHNSIDNRKANLRLATASQNRYNSRKTKSPCWSSYKGVTWDRDAQRWRARWQRVHPLAADQFLYGLRDSLRFYDLPKHWWKRVRTNNPMERLIRTLCQRLCPMGYFQNEDVIKGLSLDNFYDGTK